MAMKYIYRNISMLKYNEYNIIHFDDLIKNITNPDNDNDHYIRKDLIKFFFKWMYFWQSKR